MYLRCKNYLNQINHKILFDFSSYRARDRKRSLFFVIKPNSDFLCDDGVRYQSDGFKSLESFHNTMMSLMNKYGLNFVEMTQTDLDERVRYVIDVLVKKWGI